MLVFVFGGSGSGKSEYGEARVLAAGRMPRYYVATMEPSGAEAKKRIRRHRQLRQGKGFETVECACRIDKLRLPAGGALLIEDLSNLIANEIWGKGGRGFSPDLARLACDGIFRLAKEHALVVVVGNDIHRDCGMLSRETEAFLRLLGEAHALLAAQADEVTEVVCGIALPVKGLPGAQEGGAAMRP